MKKREDLSYKMLINLKRVIKSGWQGFFRDGGMVLVTIFTLFITILLIGSLFLMRAVTQSLIVVLQEKVDFSIYFKEKVEEESIFVFKEELARLPDLTEINYVSKEQAMEDFTQRYKDNEVLMESIREVGINPFLPSLNVKTMEASQYQAVANFLDSPDFQEMIEKVDYNERKPVIERLFSLTSAMNKTGIALSLILIIIAVLVTYNTIRMAIYNFREEIKIQRLVGADNWFIRGPFLAQGVISGVVSAFLALIVSGLLAFSLSSRFDILFSGVNMFNIFLTNIWQIILLQFIAGISLGVISALLSTRKYLKV